MTITREDLERKINSFLARAEEIRTASENMRDPETRLTMSRIAETYERVAWHLEATHVLGAADIIKDRTGETG
jgi:DNA-binding ferritin-like protein